MSSFFQELFNTFLLLRAKKVWKKKMMFLFWRGQTFRSIWKRRAIFICFAAGNDKNTIGRTKENWGRLLWQQKSSADGRQQHKILVCHIKSMAINSGQNKWTLSQNAKLINQTCFNPSRPGNISARIKDPLFYLSRKLVCCESCTGFFFISIHKN